MYNSKFPQCFFRLSTIRSPLRLKFSLCLLVVLCRVDTVLVVVDKVRPWDDVVQKRRESALTGGDALKVRAQLANAVKRLASLDLADHLLHVHLDFACVLGTTVESNCTDAKVSQSAEVDSTRCCVLLVLLVLPVVSSSSTSDRSVRYPPGAATCLRPVAPIQPTD